MGRAISIISAHMSGVRVAGQLTYVAATIKNGKKINQKATIPVIANDHRGNGGEGRSHSFKLVAWGKLADICCRSCSPGKALDVATDIQSFLGNVFDIQGNLRVDNAGQAIQTTKVSFTIEKIGFGEESNKFIAQEIQEKKRPVNWNVVGHPDYEIWRTTLKARQAIVWDGQSKTFGYARVFVPQGALIDMETYPQQQQTPNLPGQVAGAVDNNAALMQMIQQLANGGNMQNFAADNQPANNQTPANTANAAGEPDLF